MNLRFGGVAVAAALMALAPQSYASPKPEAHVITRGGVTLDMDSPQVVRLLGTSLSCGNFDVTLGQFLRMRVGQGLGYGIKMSYFIGGIAIDGDQVATVTEFTTSMTGGAIPGSPERIDYLYVVDWSGAKLAKVEPASARADPLGFFMASRAAACNGALRERTSKRSR